jgi:hypothetical protein
MKALVELLEKTMAINWLRSNNVGGVGIGNRAMNGCRSDGGKRMEGG